MKGSKRKEIMWLPYGNLITKIFGHIGFNVKDEESLEYARTRNTTLKKMWIEINSGVLTQNPPKVKKKSLKVNKHPR